MSSTGEGEFLCPKASKVEPHGIKMVARYSVNKNGGSPAWRCYGYLKTTSAESCVDDWGQLTTCLEPIASDSVYCARTEQLEAIISASNGVRKYQVVLDEYCSFMNPAGFAEFLCNRAAGVEGTMKARFGVNKNGANPTWRCYGYFNNDLDDFCLDEYGERTVPCSTPVFDGGKYCTREIEMSDMITSMKNGNCPATAPPTTTSESFWNKYFWNFCLCLILSSYHF
jgi:hypothetical protein